MATSTSPTDWFQSFYNHPNPAAPPPSSATLSGQPSDSTVVSTVATTSTLLAPSGGSADSFMGFSAATTATAANDVSGRAGNAGRVARPARRRPRASRKNPTTLLNTDTTNFRAMVQRYTGGGSMTYSAMDSAASTGFNIGGGYHHHHQQGQMGNFNHLHHHGSMAAGVDLQASQLLHQQLMMQQQGFGSTVDMSASLATGHVGPQGTDHLYPNSTTSMGGENKRDGFMF